MPKCQYKTNQNYVPLLVLNIGSTIENISIMHKPTQNTVWLILLHTLLLLWMSNIKSLCQAVNKIQQTLNL